MDDWSDDRDVIARLDKAGVDRTKVLKVDFYGYADNAEHGALICQRLTNLGLPNVRLGNDKDGSNLSFYTTMDMIVDFENVVEVQRTINEEIKDLNALCDGWGVLHQPRQNAGILNKITGLFKRS